jgi:tetratricopeptide (TPR) repeat protein
MMRDLLPMLVLASLLFAVAAPADEVTTKTLGAKKGRIIKDDASGMDVEFVDVVVSIKREDVTKVKYDLLEGPYERAEGLFKTGKYQDALDDYKEALKGLGTDKANRWARQYVYFAIAKCGAKLNKTDEAIDALKMLLAEIPETRFGREAVADLFGAYVRVKRWDDAAKSLAALEATGDEGKSLAEVYRAELLERQAEAKVGDGGFAKAAEAYRKVAAAKGLAPEALSLALAGRARCLLQDSDADAAADFARRTLAVKGCSPLAAADAHQVIGETKLRGLPEKPVDLAQDRNREQALDAIEEMMRAMLQYKGSPWAEQRGYYYVGVWAGRLGAAGVSPEWTKRASWAFEELRKKYPASPLLKSLSK